MKTSDIYDLILHLNGTQVKQELDKISQKMDLCRRNAEAAFKAGDIDSYRKWNQELAKAQRQFDRLSARSTTIERTLQNLDRATPAQLKQTIKEINRALNSGAIERGSHEWNVYTQGLQEARAELKKIKEEQNAVGQSLPQRLSGIATAFTSIKAHIQDFASQFFGLYEKFAQMDEHLVNVRKYTGLAREEVEALNEEFKKMDTRTSREQLNDLAADAGRLGIQSKQQILDFVQAADQINVALGEDLGEGAVKSIGKLAQLFGDADRLGLKQAMLSVGSVINELAQTSSASEPYIMEFTSRLAGVAHQSGLTSAQVMAFASILDQSMVGVERGATALQNVITALYAKPQKMAQAAGLNVENFTRLLHTDANAAIIQFATALNNLGGMDRLAPILKELNLSGSGVTQTLSALANNISALQQTQAQAAQAFSNGTSVTNEFNQANNTTLAQLEKTRKRLSDLAITLGQQLAPAAQGLLSLGNTLLQYLTTIIPFITRHATEIGALTAALVAHIIVLTAATIKQKAHTAATLLYATTATTTRAVTITLSVAYNLLTGNLQRATAAMRLLGIVMKTNPYALVATALLTLGTAAVILYRNTSKLNQEERTRQQLLKDTEAINRSAQQSMAREAALVNLLTAIIHDNTRTLEERRRAIAQLRQIIPSYNADITTEGRLTRENTQAINDYNRAIRRKYILQAAQSQIQALSEEQFYHEQQKGKYHNMYSIRLKRMQDFYAAHKKLLDSVYDKNLNYYEDPLNPNDQKIVEKYRQLQAQVNEANHLLAGENTFLSSLEGRLQNVQRTARRVGITLDELIGKATDTPETLTTQTPTQDPTNPTNHVGTPSGTPTTTDTTPSALERIRQENANIRAALQVQADQNFITHQEANEKSLQADINMYEQTAALYKQGTTEQLQAQHQANEARKKLQQQQALDTIQALKAQEQVEQNCLTQKYIKRDVTQKQYEQQGLEIKLKYLQLYIQRATAAGDEDSRARYQHEYDELYQSGALERVKTFWNRVDQARAEWLAKTPKEQQQDELAFAAILKSKGILTPKEYKAALQYINDKYKNNNKETTTLAAPTDQITASLAGVFKSLSDLEAKKKEGTQTWQDYASVGISSLTMLTAALSQASQLIQAQSQLEQARVTKAYDAQIKAAAGNTRRTKQLEEQKQRELAAIKTKYNNRATRIQIASAIAQTAQNAVLAYGYVVKFAGPIAAAIAAAAAIASGMIQVATIRKQAAAQEAGYYRGGYTGGHNYHRPAGIVHQGEFVLNHEATQSPALAPLLQLIDHAQRSGQVAQLTPQAVALAAAPILPTAQLQTTATRTALLSTPAPNITIQPSPTDTQTQTQTLDTLNRLTTQLDEGIRAHVVLSELDRQYRIYNRLTNV